MPRARRKDYSAISQTEEVKEPEKKEEIKEEAKEAKEEKKPVKKTKRYGKVNANPGLNVRSSALVTNNIVGSIPNGTKVVINNVATPNGWLNITCKTLTGYVMAEFVDTIGE